MEITKELEDKAYDVLVNKHKYDDSNAQTTIKLVKYVYSEDLQEAFYKYIETGEMPTYEYDGKSFEYVMNKTFSDIPGTFAYFDSLQKLEDFNKYFDNINFGKK